jgi:hypothetical protein
MRSRKIAALLTVILLAFAAASAVQAKTKSRKEYEAIVYHLKTQYHAKKVNLFVMWAARAIVSIAHPAGVKSFSLTVFDHLKFAQDKVDNEMQAAMRNSFGPEWSSIFHIRSREGQHAYMYMRDAGENVRVVLVTIDKENAAVIRATFSPDKLAEFINNPKIFGISLGDDKPTAGQPKEPVADKE